MVWLLAAHQVRLPWDAGVSPQTPPEVDMLHCASEEQVSLGPVEERVHSMPFAVELHTSQCLNDRSLSWSPNLFCASAGNSQLYIVHYKSHHGK